MGPIGRIGHMGRASRHRKVPIRTSAPVPVLDSLFGVAARLLGHILPAIAVAGGRACGAPLHGIAWEHGLQVAVVRVGVAHVLIAPDLEGGHPSVTQRSACSGDGPGLVRLIGSGPCSAIHHLLLTLLSAEGDGRLCHRLWCGRRYCSSVVRRRAATHEPHWPY